MKKIMFSFLLLTIFKGFSQTKIPLTKEQLIPLKHLTLDANYGLLVDGDIDISKTYTPSTSSEPNISWSHKILIDLRGTYNLSSLKAYDGNGMPTIKWYAGVTSNNMKELSPVGGISLIQWKTWNTLDVANNANVQGVRYVIIEQKEDLSSFPSEIEIWGTVVSIDPVVTPVDPATRPRVPAKQLLGSNGFLTDAPTEKAGLFPHYRAFTEAQWYFASNKKMRISPADGGGVNFKSNYADFTSKGCEVVSVLQLSPNYILNTPDGTHHGDYKGMTYNASFTEKDYEIPSNWNELASAYYKLAGYSGSVKIPVADLDLLTTPFNSWDVMTPPETGLKLTKWFEILNEPDKNWNPNNSLANVSYHSPYTLAALMSAAYDGHQGTMAKAGIKTADPNMKVAMGAIFKPQVEYIKAMHEWAKANRTDKKFPSDAINVHFYNSDNLAGTQGGSGAVCPEEGNGILVKKMKEIINYRNTYLPNVEIWLSEWGMSTNNGILKVPVLPSIGTKEDVQGAWMIRTYLTLMQLNLDKSYMYETSDERYTVDTGSEQFGTVGIYQYSETNTNLVKKKSWYYVTDFVNLFKNDNYKFKTDLSTSTVKDYVFEDVAKGTEMRFVWSPTGNASTVPNYNVSIAGTNITGFQFTGGKHTVDNLSTSNTITVTEVPRVYIYKPNKLAVNEFEKENLLVYPNPTTGKVTINFPVQSITVYNLAGMQLGTFNLTDKTSEIDLKNYPTGTYILKIITLENKILNTKVIKK